MKTCFSLVKSDVAEGATNTPRPLTHSLDLTKEGLAVDPSRHTTTSLTCLRSTQADEIAENGQPPVPDIPIASGATEARVANGAQSYPPGTRIRRKDGYTVLYTETGRGLEHRLVMERVLGRPLVKGETIHHINGVRADNRPENLELWVNSQPYGQRVDQLIMYMVEHHRQLVLERLGLLF